ncbi:hypothetical protein RI543_002541 [Arxiozyma heterogenica]|uniref:Diacylglycerol O-acyltransferase n=1 Tax=Arxiozyma heterogenica TaxID=278026 RepID=A0AAN7ZXW1_9SACH|nr:hypothetical protein RI543_002541 [Kazachstania heterogenica]
MALDYKVNESDSPLRFRGQTNDQSNNKNSNNGSVTNEKIIIIDNDMIQEIKDTTNQVETSISEETSGSVSCNKPVLESCCSPATPFQRRLQTLAIAFHISTIPGFIILTLFLLSFPIFWVLLIPYFIYYVFDRTPANGNIYKRYSPWFRSLPIWTYLCDYFPLKLHKSCNLIPTFIDPKKRFSATGPRYIFGYHPHGIGALGAFATFATEGCGWSKLFPGIPVSLLTIVTQFQSPLYRDYLMTLGITSVSKKNALKVLDTNQSICIVVGGVRESLLGSTDSIELILNKRKGFIKLALQTGNVSLVPVFGFGETKCFRVYETEKGSVLNKFQIWVKQKVGFTIPIFFARGLFNYDFGLIPFRTPLDIVVGKPIYIKERYDHPNQTIIDHYHKLYVDELKRIYYSNRDKFDCGNVELEIVG